jgi:hypothetical protein
MADTSSVEGRHGGGEGRASGVGEPAKAKVAGDKGARAAELMRLRANEQSAQRQLSTARARIAELEEELGHRSA